MIVYRNGKNSLRILLTDDILVKILLNEKETKVSGLSTDCFPYYHWTGLRSYLLSRIEECL